MTDIKRRFSTKEAANLSGLSREMVDYLVRQKIIIPAHPRQPGRGRPRRYSFGEVVALRAISVLLGRGLSVTRLKRAINTKNAVFRDMHQDENPARFLITDGTRVFYKDKQRGAQYTLVDLTGDGQMAFNFVIDLESVHASVVEKIRELKTANG